MSNLLDRFRQQLAKEKEQADRSTQGQKEPQDGQAVAYAGILPPDLTSVTKENRGLEERMAKITLVIPELPAEFSDIPDVRATLASKDDFPDNSWIQKDALVLELMTDNAIITMGRELFGSLSYGVSQYLVGTVFLLAYQLKGPGKGASPNLLPATDELSNLRDVKLDILDKDVPEATGNMIQPSERGKAEDVAQGYAYLAASMLKMFTKSAENYTKSWQHILSGYKKFYKVVCPISGVTPAEDVIKTIHNHFALSELFKATLYRFLYNINRSGSISSIQKYLYDIHLSHTGIIVPTVYRICSTMNCSPADLIKVVYTNRFRPQIQGLIAVFKLMRNTDENHKRQMWKYGRIFDSEFLATLQTRACPKFMYILGCILKRVNSDTAAGILDIKQLEEVSQDDRQKLWLGSKALVDELKKKN